MFTNHDEQNATISIIKSTSSVVQNGWRLHDAIEYKKLIEMHNKNENTNTEKKRRSRNRQYKLSIELPVLVHFLNKVRK